MTVTSIPTKTSKTDKPKRINKAARVRAMLAKGKSPTAIAQSLNVMPQYVYAVRAYEKKKEEKAKGTFINTPRRVGRPRKVQIATVVPAQQGVQFVPTFMAAPPTLWERIKAVFA